MRMQNGEKRERPRQPTPTFFILHSHSSFLNFQGQNHASSIVHSSGYSCSCAAAIVFATFISATSNV